MEEKDKRRYLHKSCFKYSNRQYMYSFYYFDILPILEELKKHIVDNGSVLLMSQELRECIVNNGNVPLILEELEKHIVDGDAVSSIPEEIRKYIINNDSLLQMLKKIKNYIFENDMVLLMPKERLDYFAKMQEKHNVEEVFDDVLVEMMVSKRTRMICYLDMLIQSFRGHSVQNKEEKEKRTSCIKLFKAAKLAFQYYAEFSFNLDLLGTQVARVHAYNIGYEKMIENLKKEDGNSRRDDCIDEADKILSERYQSEKYSWGEKYKKEIARIYDELSKSYGPIINTDELCFFCIVLGVEQKGKDEESVLMEILFNLSDVQNGIPDNIRVAYESSFGQIRNNKVDGKKIYKELYNIVKKVVKRQCLRRDACIVDIDNCRNFLIEMYVIIIAKVRNIKEKREEREIRMKAAPLFCNVLCSVEEYEKMKMVSLMMQLTADMMLNKTRDQNETAEQNKAVRSGHTNCFKILYMYMILNSSTFSQKKNIFTLKVPTVSEASMQCKRAIRNEFKGVDIPEWPDDENLSNTAKRCNCMMLMACFIACKDYKNPAAYTTLLYWLNEIKCLYENRAKDCNQTMQDWIQLIEFKRLTGMLYNSYCTMIAFEFAERLNNKQSGVSQMLANSILKFQKKKEKGEVEKDLKEYNQPIKEEYWFEDGTPWIPKVNDVPDRELKRYLDNNFHLKVVPALAFGKTIDDKDI